MKAALILLLLAAATTAAPGLAQNAGASYAQQAAWGQTQQRQLAIDSANERQYNQMQRVGSYMDQYCAQNHRWPDQGEEQRFIEGQLNQLVPVNPYTQGDAAWLPSGDNGVGPQNIAGNLPVEMYNDNIPQGNRVKLVFDPSLNTTMAKEYMNDPPDDWNGAPGSITGVSNNQDLFIIWGAGVDGKPLKNAAGQMRLVFGRFGMLYWGE